MPMLITVRIRSPVKPFHEPSRTASAKDPIRSSVSWTHGTTFCPSTRISSSRGARSAMCSTGRSSVTLIRWPVNIASMRPRSSAASASATNSRIVSRVTRFFE
jgi:hypothetical protein